MNLIGLSINMGKEAHLNIESLELPTSEKLPRSHTHMSRNKF